VTAERKFWIASMTLAGICAIAMGWLPLLTITALPSVNYDEGWNAYRQWMALQGQKLYGSPPGLWTTNYPFLSFHIVALLSGAKAHMVLAGRVVCFASLVAVAVLTGLIVHRETGSRAAAVYAGLCLFAWLGAFNGQGRAMDDPEMLSAACATLGLYAYVSGRQFLWLAAVAFACSLFIKHDVIGFPLSVAVHLAVARQWRGLAVFAAVGTVVCGLLLTLSYHLDGPYFFPMFLQPRAYLWRNIMAETLHYLLHFAVPLAVGVAALWRARGFWLILLACTNLLAIGFAGGDGVAANIFYPAIIATVLACVIGLCRLEGKKVFAPTLAAVTLAGAVMVPFQFREDIAALQREPARTAAARQVISLLETTKGPVLCEDMLLCYDAGKALDFDPYYVRDQILIGHMREDDVVALLAAHHFAAVQMDGRPHGRFTKGFLQALAIHYRPVLVSRDDVVFVPGA
jgi:hypothetical protein